MAIPQLLRPVVVEHRAALAGVVGWSLVAALPALASGRLIAVALDGGFLAGRAPLGFALLAVYAAALVSGAFAVRQAMRPMGVFTEAVRDHLVRTVVRGGLGEAVAAGRGAPGVGARLVGQVETARQIVSNLVMSVTSAGLMVLAAAIGLVALAPVALVALVPLALATGVALVALTRAWRRRYRAALAREEALADEVDAVLRGVRDVAACGAAGRAAADLDRLLGAHAAAVGRAADLGGARIAVIGAAARLPLLFLLLLAPGLLDGGALTPGELVGAVVYVVSGLEPAWRAAAEILGNQGVELGALLARLGRRPAVPEPPASGVRPPERGALALRSATFRYGEHSDPVLDRADLVIADGEWVVVLGPSGIGKSTLASVLTGLERPESGSVEFAGLDLSRYRAAELRRRLALIPQEAYVFSGTVRANLALLAPDADDAAIGAAVRAVGLEELVARHGGLDGQVVPRALSAGERQLVALGRVHLSPARVVVLDEATCHLDPAAEARAEHAFHRRGGTLVVIAHRATSAARAHRVLVLDETGLHDRAAAPAPGGAPAPRRAGR
ncbi:ATP-binding cassette domain-containing protein [Saccharothrix algeriensis]|uniref:ATP-binding cassette subfamily C protein n=3 Tax=Saccharothrix algeriensis TaxID=173560 RepID=A0ABS2SEP4_9PSEU|nr:ATP-binding cassette domain-containing protein [Saccharothrix algeriensis]MBM7814745.1 ATP-binding cassette subfamily C protein [Saccharothrix algeriensis]